MISSLPDTVAAPERSVETIFTAPTAHWVGDGFHVAGYFSQGRGLLERMSPFLLLDYHAPYVYPATENLRRGVGPHPHRGFETVTVAFEGSVAHHDSTGAGGVIVPGDVQWMTSGGGILHKEYHEASFARAGGTMHMMQIWVNLPAAQKMIAPTYQLLEAAHIPNVVLADEVSRVRIIAGQYAGKSGAARTHTPIDMLDVHLQAGAHADFTIDALHNTAILLMRGNAVVNDACVLSTKDFALLAHDGEHFRITATPEEDVHCMVLSGEPIDEPVVQYGPFVMNTDAEIRRAILDFNKGDFGTLAE